MNNKYSLSLLMATGIILLVSLVWLIFIPAFWNIFGLIPFIFGCTMVYQGLRSPESKPTRKIWLLTCFGMQTDVVIEGLTFICNWLPLDIVDFIEIDMEIVDAEFPVVNVLCKKEVNGALVNDGYVSGDVSTAFIPDDSSAETLLQFINAGGAEGVKLLLKGIIAPQAQVIGSTHSNDWMETHNEDVALEILRKVEGAGGNVATNPDVASDDTQGLGIRFKKFTAFLKPASEVITARNDQVKEEAERAGDLADNATINAMITERQKLSHQGTKDANGVSIIDPDATPLTVAMAQDQVALERAMKAGKYQRVDNRQGVNVLDLH